MRRTKLLVTLGPASAPPGVLERMLACGADAFRINFSHGSDDEHRSVLRRVRGAAARVGRDVALVADLQGPKIRLGDLVGGSVELATGANWRLDTRAEPGSAARVPVQLEGLTSSVRVGDPLIVGDGLVELEATSVDASGVNVAVRHGGRVTTHAGLFLPRAKLRPEIVGPKDLHDLDVALREGVDFVALSFVRAASDLVGVRKRLAKAGRPEVGLIAKIERAEALQHIEGILAASDGIMVARGDLGIELPLERLALEQKRLVARANAARKPAIVATQMLLSMVASPRPTRAEATDVANAVLDGADAVMLSEESAVGEFPAESVESLHRICESTEAAVRAGELSVRRPPADARAPESPVARAAVQLATEVGASAIVTPTHSGRTARWVAAERPTSDVIALSALEATRRRLALTWGVESRECPADLPLDQLRTFAERLVAARRGARRGDRVVLTAGYPIEGRPTNLVTVVEVGASRGSGPRRRSRAASRS